MYQQKTEWMFCLKKAMGKLGAQLAEWEILPSSYLWPPAGAIGWEIVLETVSSMTEPYFWNEKVKLVFNNGCWGNIKLQALTTLSPDKLPTNTLWHCHPGGDMVLPCPTWRYHQRCSVNLCSTRSRGQWWNTGGLVPPTWPGHCLRIWQKEAGWTGPRGQGTGGQEPDLERWGGGKGQNATWAKASSPWWMLQSPIRLHW